MLYILYLFLFSNGKLTINISQVTPMPSPSQTGPSVGSTPPSLITTPSFAMPQLPPTPMPSSMLSAQPLPPSKQKLGQYSSPSSMSSTPFQGFSTPQSELGMIAQRLQTPLQQRMSSQTNQTLSPEQRTRAMRNRALALRKRKTASQDPAAKVRNVLFSFNAVASIFGVGRRA